MLLHLLTAGFSVLPCAKSVSSVPRAVIRRKIVLQKRTPVNAHDCQSIWKGARSRFEANHLWEQPTQETRLVATIEPEASVRKAADWLRVRNIGTLVVTSGNAVLGVISEREIVHALSRYGETVASMPVKEIMR